MNKTPALVLLGLMTVNAFGADSNIFSYRLGRFDVYTLVENRGPGRDSILIGANADAVKRYLGASFQSETNTFLIRAPDRNILVDTGFGTTLFESMKTLGISPGEIDTVLLTHLHGDHIGGLQRDGKPLFPNAKVYLARQEREFWTRTSVNRNAVNALAAYGGKVETFLPGELGSVIQELLPGITAIAAFGHTPGHTVFQVESDGKRLLIWGDLMHVEGIQFPLPDVSVTYDTDPAAAAAIRKKILAYAVSNNIPIAGMHLLYPAIGSVRAQDGAYRLVPAGQN
ncbi:MAG: MBL fold metallo-hydrolase [Spirochaetaceae bacterium]|jgi:glyoxylase-like metal-dependent hydrolase (beta-lactamase superfamily II)|nr:MBL fold metallo-hydrolase [Spirochaetaceae bacterium]